MRSMDSENQFARTELLLGADGLRRLADTRVALFGVGGVGGYVAEALVRSGVGAIDLFDDDRVCLSNLNRQIIALHSTVGEYKVDVMARRLKDVNPDVQVAANRMFYMPENADQVDLSAYTYIVDAIDTVTAKVELITRAFALNVPIISAMGAGNKLDPTRIRITDIYKTSGCPLARVMRHELRKRGIPRLTVAFSDEPSVELGQADERQREQEVGGKARRAVPGSTSFVPSAMGLAIAGAVVRSITGR